MSPDTSNDHNVARWTAGSNQFSWIPITIEAVKRPLAFAALTICAIIVVSTITVSALELKGSEAVTVVSIFVGAILLFSFIVIILLIVKPDIVLGSYGAFDKSFAIGLGQSLYLALDGYLDNLPSADRDSAFIAVRDAFDYSPYGRYYSTNEKQKEFCDTIVCAIVHHAKIKTNGGPDKILKGIIVD